MQSCTVSSFPIFPSIKDIVIPVSNPVTLYTRGSDAQVTLPLYNETAVYLSRDLVPLSQLDTTYMYNTYLPASNVHGAEATMLGQPHMVSTQMNVHALPMVLEINPNLTVPVHPPTQDIRSDTQTQLNRN